MLFICSVKSSCSHVLLLGICDKYVLEQQKHVSGHSFTLTITQVLQKVWLTLYATVCKNRIMPLFANASCAQGGQ